ncbi:hypothetical protein NOCA2570086 [metagenome]|uniref:Uncharacterized protein n=1 Tax=metagenome TaxID=256318 RepID=A0A2P2CB38_9ZZZZ
MTDHDLATLLHEHVRSDEQPFSLDPDATIAVGRRALRRRRARRTGLGVLVAAASAAVVLPFVTTGGPGGTGREIDPATAAALESYDASAMPQLIEDLARQEFQPHVADLGAGRFRAGDSQGQWLPPRYYDKASTMSVSFGGQGDHRISVDLMHARSEAEGDARQGCLEDVESGYTFSCVVTTSEAGDTVVTSVWAVRPLDDGMAGWGAVTRDELRTGVVSPTDPSQSPIDYDEVYFQRHVESVHSETFLTGATETVRAPDLATASSLWRIPARALERVVTDPSLVIPEPPIGEGDCPWTLPGTGVECGP